MPEAQSVVALNSFRDPSRIEARVRSIRVRSERVGPVKLMHVCGSHERTAAEWGIRSLVPKTLELIPGPGCPVCVCAEHDIGEAIELAKKGVCITSFGDMLRVRTRFGSLASARAEGGDIRVVYGPDDALALARKNPDRDVVFFAVGFETSTAPVAGLFAKELPNNFSILTSLKLTSPAVEALVLGGGSTPHALHGLVAPGHVSTIVGAKDWERFPAKYGLPAVVAGFEPLDLLAAFDLLLEMIENKEVALKNEYSRVVRFEGNPSALHWIQKVLEVKEAFWRAVGWVPGSSLFLREEVAAFDARKKYGVSLAHLAEKTLIKGCKCHLIVLGKAYPSECGLFGKRCTLLDPVGPCMVSDEGACRIWQQFGEKGGVA